MIRLTMLLKLRRHKKIVNVMKIQQFTNIASSVKDPGIRMQTWQIHAYGGVEQLQLTNARIPMISKPTEILVQVHAASLNPIDVAMINGYGSQVLNLMRRIKNTHGDIEFPLTTGRDFCGVIVSKGHHVGTRLNLGDEVWGVVPVEQQGSHAQYIVVESNLVNVKPANLSYIEAASILYAGLTAWSALWLTGGLCYKQILFPLSPSNQRILILGGSGGVGSLAIQLAKAWNLQVITTSSGDAINMLQNLGADHVIDYHENNANSQVINHGPYDIILDCCNLGPKYVRENDFPYKTYITLNSPLLRNIDEHGFIRGTAKNLGDLMNHNLPAISKSGIVKWGFFTPSRSGINALQKLVENKQIVPVVEQVYPFQDLHKAYERASRGHSRGKLVVDMRNSYETE